MTPKVRAGWENFATVFMRGAERALPPPALHAVLWPFATLIAVGAVTLRRRDRSMGRLPWSVSPATLIRDRTRMHLSRALGFWRDRFGTDRWRSRCRFEGLEHIDRNRPALLVTVHYGPLQHALTLLRANRVAATGMVANRTPGRRSAQRRRVDRLEDRAFDMETVPRFIVVESLFDARDHLSAGGILLMAVDGGAGPRRDVRHGDVRAQLADGAIRIAQAGGAAVHPYVVQSDAGLGCTLRVGPAIDAARIEDRRRHDEAYSELLGGLLEFACETPGQCRGRFLRSLAPATDAPTPFVAHREDDAA